MGRVGVVMAVALCVAGSAFACAETTVRLAGFQAPRDMHTLCVVSSEGEDEASRLTEWFENNAPDLNLTVTHISPDDPEVRWEDYALPSAPSATPVTFLVGRHTEGRRSFVIDHWEPGLTEADLEALASSPVREALKGEVIDSTAVLLYSPKDRKAAPVLNALVEEYATADAPVTLIEFDRSDPKERMLTAFTGLREDDPDWVGVVFARGKLMAPPLVGEYITGENLNHHLERLEAPCTCLESPAALGVDFPLTWDATLDALAAPLMPLEYSEGVFEEVELPPLPAPVEEQLAQETDSLFQTAIVGGVAVAGVAVVSILVLLVRLKRAREAL